MTAMQVSSVRIYVPPFGFRAMDAGTTDRVALLRRYLAVPSADATKVFGPFLDNNICKLSKQQDVSCRESGFARNSNNWTFVFHLAAKVVVVLRTRLSNSSCQKTEPSYSFRVPKLKGTTFLVFPLTIITEASYIAVPSSSTRLGDLLLSG